MRQLLSSPAKVRPAPAANEGMSRRNPRGQRLAGDPRPGTSSHIAGAVLLCLGYRPTDAADNTYFSVNAVVRPQLTLQVTSVRSLLDLAPADVARGSFDAGQLLEVTVTSNSRDGFVLDFQPVGNVVRGAEVLGLEQPLVLGSEGGAYVYRWNKSGTVRLHLRFRFDITPGVAPGEYALPYHLSAHPLTQFAGLRTLKPARAGNGRL